LACDGGGVLAKVEVENKCKNVDEKEKSWERTMLNISLSLISFNECIKKSYKKMLMH
jgi:hypothetical protein